MQALEAAIDRDAINAVVYNGEGMAGNQWVSPKSPYFQSKYPVPKRDIAKAKKLIEEAGLKTPVTVDFMVPNTTDAKQMAEVVQAMAIEAGIDMKIRLTEFATSLKEAEDGRFQAFLIGWSGRVDPDGNSYIFFKTKAPQNNGFYSDADVDKWLDEQRTVSDPAARKAIYEKITQKQLTEGAIVYLAHRPIIVAHAKTLTGFVPMPDGLIRVVGVKVAK